MKTKRVPILNQNGNPISETKALLWGLLWGNNAAWLCVKCGELVGSRTGSSEKSKTIECSYGQTYLLLAKPNRTGLFNKGSAEAVVLT
jgi:hypothetical protein